MSPRELRAVAGGRRWLLQVAIPDDDVERHIQRLFALAITRANLRDLRRCARKLPAFTWFHYRGDPVPALVAGWALESAGCGHPSLSALRQGYRDLLADSEVKLPLLCALLQVPDSSGSSFEEPPVFELMTASRDQILEVCRAITMSTAGGVKQTNGGEAATLLPHLAFSLARDWDIEASCSLLRACHYLGLSDGAECKWTLEWLLDQQQEDGRFGLLLAEASKCGWAADDWRPYFERTIHALWALSDISYAPLVHHLSG